ncbi:hypothetical protein J6590_048030 [Homalodisca vitripennis]|nr:hypothetical protein J6590_048030 [Homalodisca vitripennis]
MFADVIAAVTSEPPPKAGQAGCLQGQDRSADTHPSSSHARRCFIRLSRDNRRTRYTGPLAKLSIMRPDINKILKLVFSVFSSCTMTSHVMTSSRYSVRRLSTRITTRIPRAAVQLQYAGFGAARTRGQSVSKQEIEVFPYWTDRLPS